MFINFRVVKSTCTINLLITKDFLSTYICHPSMANNEISGPVVALQLAKWIKSLKDNRFSYRILFVPETIGAISYLSLNDNYLYLKKYIFLRILVDLK